MEATDKARAHSSTVFETSADDSRDGWYAPAKVRDSWGAQWTYFPSIISGSNVPEGGWSFKPTACSTACNVVVYAQLVITHAAIHVGAHFVPQIVSYCCIFHNVNVKCCL